MARAIRNQYFRVPDTPPYQRPSRAQGIFRGQLVNAGFAAARGLQGIFRPRVGGEIARGKHEKPEMARRLKGYGRRRRSSVRRRPVARSSGMSNQYNMKVSYRRKRPMKRMARKAKRWNRSINRVIDKRLAKNNYTWSIPFTNLTLGPGLAQAYGAFNLFGSNSSLSYEGDLRTMFRDQHSSEHGSDIALPPDGEKLTILSAVVEAMIVNTSAYTCEVEIYEVIPKHDVNANQPLSDYFVSSFNDTPVTGGTTTGITKAVVSASALRVTPFDSKAFCSDFTIVKSRRYLVPAGSSINFDYKVYKPQYLSFGRVNTAGWIRGLYKGFLYRVMPMTTIPTASQTIASIAIRKSYSITRLEENEPSAQQITNTS